MQTPTVHGNIQPGGRFGELVIERELGRGAFAVVYLARDTLLERPVALKVLTVSRISRSEEERKRLLQEARLVARLQSPNIVAVYRAHELGEAGLALELEYMPGGSIADALKRGGPLAPSEALAHARDLLHALEAAHEAGIVHRDVKPENLLLTARGEVKLADFGLGRQTGEESLSLSGSGRILGTPLYMAPEVIRGDRATPLSDLWSVGVLLYQMLTGRRPFEAASIPALFFAIHHEEPAPLPSSVPAPLAAIVERCLQKEAGRRPPSAAALRQELEDLTGAAPPSLPPPRAVRASAPEPEPLVGREPEAERLDALLTEAEGGTGGAAVLLGEAGMGKTALLRSAARRAEARGFRALEAVLTPLGGLVRALVEASRRVLLSEVGAASLAGPHLSVRFGAAAPLLRTLLQGAEPEGQGRQPVVWAVESLLRGLAAEQPVVWTLEDAQLADADDLKILSELVRRLAGTRTALIVAYRSNDPLASQEVHATGAALGEFLHVPGVRSVPVGPLPPEGLRRVLAAQADGARIVQEVLERIEETAEGNPLLARELFAHLIAAGEVERRGERWLPAARWGTTALPPRLRDLVAARLGLLDEGARQVVDAAAVDGLTFDPEAVAAVLGTGVLSALRLLQRLHRQHHLVTPLKHGFRFAQALFREVIYAELAPSLRAAMHRTLAEHLESHGQADGDPERVGAHWEGAGEPDRARPYLARSAAAAAGLQQNRRALALLERAGLGPAALTPGRALEHGPALVSCAHSYAETERGEDAEALLTAVAAAARAAGNRALELRALVEQAFLHLYRGGAHTVDRSALAAAAAELPLGLGRGRASYVLGLLAKQEGDLAAAEEHLRRAEATWKEAGNEGARASALDQLGAVAWRAGRLDEARAHYEEAAAVSGRAGRRLDAAASEVNLALVQADLGRDEATEALLERALETFAVAGARSLEEHTRVLLAERRWRAGRAPEASAAVERSLGALRGLRFLPAAAEAQRLHFEMLTAGGRVAEAGTQAAEARTAAERLGDREVLAQVDLVDAALAAALGDAAAAERAAERALGAKDRLPSRARAKLALHLGQDALLRGAPERARAALGLLDGAGRARSVDERLGLALAEGALARLDPSRADDLPRATKALLEEPAFAGVFLAQAAGRLLAAEGARRRGRHREAAALLEDVVARADGAQRAWWALVALRAAGEAGDAEALRERDRRLAVLAAALPEAPRAALLATWAIRSG